MDAISYAKASSAYKLASLANAGLVDKANMEGSSILVPVGTTATRPVLGAGESALRYNSDAGGLEEWTGTEWKSVSADISAVSLQGVDTEANILAKVGMVAEDLWIASDTLDGYVYDGTVWINIGPLQGPKGDMGISAYQVAVNNGFVGTQIEWLESLIGAQGLPGNGIVSVTKTGTIGLVDTYTITFTNSTATEFNVTNGVAGLDIDHVSKTSGTSAPGTTDIYTVWGDVGETINLGTFNVYNGANGAVISVAGKSGDVVLFPADVGLSNVDNTTDANKPVSIATQTALNLKADATALTTKQDALVSGTNIKTVNGTSVLGSGDMVLDTNSTLATLNKSFTANEEVEIQLNKSVNTPIVSVTKEVPQVNITNSTWDVSGSNYEIDTELEYVGNKIQIKKDPTFNFANNVSFVPSSLSASPSATIRCIGLSNGKFAVIHTNSANSPTLAIYNSNATVSLAQFVFPKTASLLNYAFSLIELSNGNIFCAFPNNSGYLSCTVVTQDGSQVGTLTITDPTYASISDYAISCCEFSNGNICIMFSGNKSGAGIYKHIVIVNNLCQIVYPTLQINTSYGYGNHISSCKVGADVFFAQSFDSFASKYVKLTKISATGAVTEVVSVNANGSATTDSFGLKLIALDNGNMACLQRHTVSTPYNGSIDIFTPAGVKVNASTIVVVSLSGQTDNNIGDIYQVTNGFVWLGYSKVDGTKTLTAILYDNNGAFLSKHLLSTTATPYTVQYWNKRYLFFTAATTMFTGMFGDNITYIKNKYLPSVSTQINTTFWSDINSMTANETLNGQTVNYALSADNRITWKVIKTGSGARNIVKNDSGTWKYNTATAEMTSETWTNATTNTEFKALSEAMSIPQNNMPSSQLQALTDSEQIVLGDELNLAQVLYTNSASATPIADGVTINYDANAKNVIATANTDYTWSTTNGDAGDVMTFKALANNNLKIRVV